MCLDVAYWSDKGFFFGVLIRSGVLGSMGLIGVRSHEWFIEYVGQTHCSR